MAKINHNNFIDTINNIMVTAREEGIVHLQAEDAKLTGRTIQIKGKKMHKSEKNPLLNYSNQG